MHLIPGDKPNLDHDPQWRDYVKETIEYFLSTLPPNISEKLDYSPTSFKTIEAWLLEKYPDIKTVLEEPDNNFWEGIVLYVGETYRINLGGFWNVHFAESEPDYPYGEARVVEGFLQRNPQSAFAPAWIILDMIKYRDEQGLSLHLEALLKLVGENSDREA